MAFADMNNAKLDVIKQDGAVIEGVGAVVSSSSHIIITSPPKGLLIEPEDLLRRRMSNGGEETFRVIDPSFSEGALGLPPFYDMKVQKLGIQEARQAVQSVTYNINGNNARVNNHSTDNSVNTVSISSSVSNCIQQLRDEIEKADIPADGKEDARDVIDAVEAQVESGKPKKSVLTALIGSLPTVGAVSTIGKNLYDLLHASGVI